MKITKRQALKLFDIVSASCSLNYSIGGWTAKVRVELVNEIINQQDDENVEMPAGNRMDVIQEIRTRLRDDGVVDRPMGSAASPNIGTSGGGNEAKAAYDW